MGQWRTELSIKEVFEGMWELQRPLIFWSDILTRIVIVPTGFCTDMASVPRLPLVWLLCGDAAHRPATMHDYLYSQSKLSRERCDDLFLEGMEAEGMPSWRSKMMYAGVRLFGGPHYGGKEK